MSHLLHPFSFSLLLFPFFFFVSIPAQSDDKIHPQCRSSTCGETNITYPFWKIDDETTTTQFCGYEGFGIHCSNSNGRNIPHANLGGEDYFVSKIASSSILLVDYDVSSINLPPTECPRVRHNIDWGDFLFSYSGRHVNLSFHYNCTAIPSFATEIRCLSNPTKKSCVNSVNSVPEGFSWDGYSCDDHVETMVLDRFGSASEKRPEMVFIGALREGFELRWDRTDDCKKCEDSGGWCGYSNSKEFKFTCFCSDGATSMDICKGSRSNLKIKLFIGIVSAVLSIVLIIIIYCIVKSPSRKFVALFKHQTEDDQSVEAFVIQYGTLSTKRYTYADIKKITNSFRVKLGQGGFGVVFKGKLSDERLVAVKVLNSSKASGQEFINEVASIGRTSHVNIVSLLGFCFEYQRRALVYEFMPNGSLEKFTYSCVPVNTSERIGVEKLFEIALGIARGLDYLHCGCNTRILHLDIKPHNILLDEDFCPKIADFGLAKLYSRKESIVSMIEARGTIGYIAPEVFNRSFGGVSHKSDVYSYGMLILEMVGGRNNVDAGVGSGHTSEIYFPYWIYNRLKKDEFLLDIVTTVEENDYVRKMTIVGLWCIQTEPKKRPSINEVIDMLDGSMEALEIPPKPFFSSPPQSPATTFNTLQEVTEDDCSSKKE